MEKTLSLPRPLARVAVGHPLRRQLAQSTLHAQAAAEDRDIKLFVLSFTAFFICFYTFIF